MFSKTFNTGADLTDSGGGGFSIANPEGVDCYITRLVVDVTTKATAACTIDIGVGAGATTTRDNLLDGLDVGTAIIATDNVKLPGTNGKAGMRWESDEFLVGSRATGAIAGVVGRIHVEYVRCEDTQWSTEAA